MARGGALGGRGRRGRRCPRRSGIPNTKPVASPSGPATATWRSSAWVVVGAAKLTMPSADSPGSRGLGKVTSGRSELARSSVFVSSAVRLGRMRSVRSVPFVISIPNCQRSSWTRLRISTVTPFRSLACAVEDAEELVQSTSVAHEVDDAERTVGPLDHHDHPVHRPLERWERLSGFVREGERDGRTHDDAVGDEIVQGAVCGSPGGVAEMSELQGALHRAREPGVLDPTRWPHSRARTPSTSGVRARPPSAARPRRREERECDGAGLAGDAEVVEPHDLPGSSAARVPSVGASWSRRPRPRR